MTLSLFLQWYLRKRENRFQGTPEHGWLSLSQMPPAQELAAQTGIEMKVSPGALEKMQGQGPLPLPALTKTTKPFGQMQRLEQSPH